MEIITADFKKGFAKLKVTDEDDLWYLSHLIDKGDLLKGKTTRKIKIGDGENAKTVKKTYTVKIEAETIEYGNHALRINGKIKEGPEELPKDSYQAIALEVSSEFSVEKSLWLNHQKKQLEEATIKKYNYLLCIFDREEAIFAVTKKFGYDILTRISGEVPKKSRTVEIHKDFYLEIIKTLEMYFERYNPEQIIVASPAFYKDDLYKKITNPYLKEKIVLTVCSDLSERALDEVLKRPELAPLLKTSRAREEQLLIDELLEQISKEGNAVYGWQEVLQAIIAGAVRILLTTDEYIQQQKEQGTYQQLDEVMKQADALQAKIHILSSELESGKKLQGLGGIAALLRFKISWSYNERHK